MSSLISKVNNVPGRSWYKKSADGDDDGVDGYDYAPAACMEGDGDDDDGDYDYAPAASMEGDGGDDNDDCVFDYASAAWTDSLINLSANRPIVSGYNY